MEVSVRRYRVNPPATMDFTGRGTGTCSEVAAEYKKETKWIAEKQIWLVSPWKDRSSAM